jgi:hypothetical protein
MRLKFIPSLLYAWLLWLPCIGAQVSAQPSPVRSPDRLDGTTSDQAQISAGDLLLKDRAFKEAEAAYAKALQSMDRITREKALHSLERSLRHRHDSWVLIRETLHGARESLIRGLPAILSILFLWWALGWAGKWRGRRRCVFEDLDKENPGFAKTFHLAYLKALEERRYARRLKPGPLGPRPVTAAVWSVPTIEKDIEQTALFQLVSLASQDVGKVASVFIGRFRRPRLRLHVALFDDAPLILIGLEDKGRIIQVWSEALGTSDLFKPRCRLLREIMAYIEQKIRTKHR